MSRRSCKCVPCRHPEIGNVGRNAVEQLGQVVCGLPAEVSSQLSAAAQIETKSLDTILEQPCVLTSEQNQVATVAARQQTKKSTVERRKIVCYECVGDHPMKVCKERKPVTCWKCGESEHISWNCTAGNRYGDSCASTIPPRV